MQTVEILLWTLPLVLALRLAVRAPRGARNGWLLLAAGCAVIVTDKAFNIQLPLYQACKDVVHALDPELRLRGEHLWIRFVLLGGLFAIGCTGIVFFLRWDRELTRAKGVALLGLAMVMAYLGLRLLPRIHASLTEPQRLAIEGTCLAVVLAGLWMGAAGRPTRCPPER
jgi:hypothetical protein